MADDLSFTISAEDQASKVVDTVKSKINNFGNDVAKMALGIAGPMALVSLALGFIMKKVDEYKQSKIDARNASSREEEEIEKATTEKNKEEFKKRLDAYKKAEAEKTAALKAEEERRKKKTSLGEEIKALQADLQNGGPLTGVDLLKDLSDKVKDAKRDFTKAQRDNALDRQGVTDVTVLEAQKKYLEAQKAFREEDKKQNEQNAKDKKEGKVSKPEEVKTVKETAKLTVSSLREIGGSFGGGDINTGIERQVELAQKQVDVLSTIAQNTTPKDPVGTAIEMQDTNFTLPGGKTISAAELLGF